MSGRLRRKLSSAALQLSASSTSYPWEARKSSIPKRIAASSSITRTLGPATIISSRTLILMDRQPNSHDSSSIGPIPGDNITPVLLRDLVNNGEAEAGSAMPSGKEGLEDMGKIVIGEAGPGIGYQTLDPALAIGAREPGLEDHVVSGGRVLNGVLQQILEDPQQTIAVELHRRKLIRNPPDQPYSLRSRERLVVAKRLHQHLLDRARSQLAVGGTAVLHQFLHQAS